MRLSGPCLHPYSWWSMKRADHELTTREHDDALPPVFDACDTPYTFFHSIKHWHWDVVIVQDIYEQ